ncbi:MAG: acetate--CoA ligase [Actinomycetota bacterium]
MDDSLANIEALLSERRVIPAPTDFAAQAHVSDESVYERANADYQAFWEGQAEQLSWFSKWDQVMDWDPPWVKWFVGGKLNASYNCLDRHVENGGGDKVAFYWEGEPGDKRTITYAQLLDEVGRFANGLKALGVKRGDRVAIYLGMVPQLPVAMLACARLGAPHSVIFGGFSAESLRDRINDSGCSALITADGGYRRGSVVPLRKAAEDALTDCPTIEHVITVTRTGDEYSAVAGRDHTWDEVVSGQSSECPPERMDAEDMLYLLYTSGTTGKPKGIVHTTGGYMTGVTATHKWIFDIHDDDVYWCAADIGWVTGHSYIVYGPLANHTTSIIYEGAPDWPDKDRLWDIAERYRATILYTAPTAIRTFMRWGPEYPQQHDLSALRLLGSVGEPINPEAWMWYWEYIGGQRCPIVDTWWQTETGSIMITPLPGLTDLKPGSATRAFPGVEADILDEQGNSVPLGSGGALVLKHPWPAMFRTIYGDPDRYVQNYFSRYGPQIYLTGDGAKRDEEGYYWLLGRMDDVMNVAGHRLSTYEIESALVDNDKVAEAAVVARPDDIVGQAIVAFVTLKSAYSADESTAAELREHVAKVIGKIARPHSLVFTNDLPKTRSGKIMRRLLRDVAEGRPLGDVTTLANAEILEQIREAGINPDEE